MPELQGMYLPELRIRKVTAGRQRLDPGRTADAHTDEVRTEHRLFSALKESDHEYAGILQNC